jgi:hypothetical protein
LAFADRRMSSVTVSSTTEAPGVSAMAFVDIGAVTSVPSDAKIDVVLLTCGVAPVLAAMRGRWRVLLHRGIEIALN